MKKAIVVICVLLLGSSVSFGKAVICINEGQDCVEYTRVYRGGQWYEACCYHFDVGAGASCEDDCIASLEEDLDRYDFSPGQNLKLKGLDYRIYPALGIAKQEIGSEWKNNSEVKGLVAFNDYFIENDVEKIVVNIDGTPLYLIHEEAKDGISLFGSITTLLISAFIV